MPAVCGNCRYWQQDDDKNQVCMRFPPAVMEVDDQLIEVYPLRSYRHWCGEHYPVGPMTEEAPRA